MSVISRLIVVAADARIGAGLRFGFERAGAQVALAREASQVAELLQSTSSSDAERASKRVIVAGPGGDATNLLPALRDVVRDSGEHVPIMWLGHGITRNAALAAGAAEYLPQPLYVRDVVTVAQLLASGVRNSTTVFRGELGDYGGVYYLMRALAAIGYSGVLSLLRGLRQGELRFYQGEVTSAQVGMMHGIAALHQVLLWSAASFELRQEAVVRRQQIPLSPAELIAEAQRFLDEVREVADAVEHAATYEQVPGKAEEHDLPDEVSGVLELVDGHRALADVVEDSPFRMFETLRIVNRLARLGMIRKVEAAQPRGAYVTLSLGEWMSAARIPGLSKLVSARASTEPGASGDGGLQLPSLAGLAGKDGEAGAQGPRRAKSEEDWSELGLTGVSSEGGLSQLVPAAKAAGEIVVGGARRAVAAQPDRSQGDEPAAQPARETQAEEPAGISVVANQAAAAPASAEAIETVKEATRESENAEESSSAASAGVEVLATEADTAAGGAGAAEEGVGGAAAAADVSAVAAEPAEAEAAASARDAARQPAAGGSEFTEDEEAFFREGARLANAKPPPAESFDDLDRGYQPQTFWQRLFGGRRRRAGTAPGAAAEIAVSERPRRATSDPGVKAAPAAAPDKQQQQQRGNKRQKGKGRR